MSRITEPAASHKWVIRDTVAAVAAAACLFGASVGAKPAPKAVPKPAPAAPVNQVLHDYWYTVTVQPKNVRYAYFNDRVEKRDGRLFFQNRFWKREEGYLNEEQLGAYAADDAKLTPLFFNFHSTFRTTEVTVDGTFQDGKLLTVKTRQGDKELPIVKRSVPSKVFLAVFFPLWLGQRLPDLKVGSTIGFMSILEDSVDAGFATMHGRVRREVPDEFAKKHGATRLTVDFREVRSTWYVEPSGMPLRIDLTSQKAIVDRVPREAAQRFLDE